MERYLDTRGMAYLGIGICDRCSRKFSITELYRDPNFPGLRVCMEDLDVLGPVARARARAGGHLPAPPAPRRGA
jgi:hypothetical protein